MRRLLATIRCDLTLQARNGFYFAAAAIVMLDVFLLRSLPPEDLGPLIVATLVSNIIVNTFYFIGAMVLLEKAEGTLEAQIVTPVRPREYLASKTITLSLLSVVESALIVLFGLRHGIHTAQFVAGVILAACFFSFAGFATVAKYDSLNAYLLPSVLAVSLLSLPLLPLFGFGEAWWLHWHPLQPAVLLMDAALREQETRWWTYGAGYGIVSLCLAGLAAGRAFRRHVVARRGANR